MKMSTKMGMIALALVVAGSASAQITGTIINKDDKAISGAIRWKNSQKAYAVAQGNVDIEVPLANVKEVQVPRPKEYDTAVNLIQQGNPSGAVPLLEKVANDYLMLQWDTLATRLLGDAYLKAGEADKALRVCEKIVTADPEKGYLGEMAPIYWQALLKLDRKSKVEDLVTKAIKSGNRESSAFALLMRGDLLAASGDTQEISKKSLRDGYLRVATLYRDVKTAQPEALYKAAKCFEKLGQTARSDQMRTTLKSEYSASEWARKP
jgi:tetratricopeptide (TPR) repeat protein